MHYRNFDPDPTLKPFVACFWIVSGDEKIPQKVLSDGHSELIFHFGDPYQIQLNGQWQTQSRALAAGQLSKPIHLRPTGSSGMVGVKFTPTGLWQLFGWNMALLSNQAIPLREFVKSSEQLLDSIDRAGSDSEIIKQIEKFLSSALIRGTKRENVGGVIEYINKATEQLSISGIAKYFQLSNRKLERLFHDQVGVSPKLYMRMTRFKHVYKLLQQSRLNRAEISHVCGYFDQPHFNKDFRKFTGEDAGTHFSQHNSLAEFFLNR
jgi:AraC-like DNA-binding protein